MRLGSAEKQEPSRICRKARILPCGKIHPWPAVPVQRSPAASSFRLIIFSGEKTRFLIPRPFPLEEVVLPGRARMALRDPCWLGAADHSYPAFRNGIWSGRDSLRLASQQVRSNRLTRIRGPVCDREHIGHDRMAKQQLIRSFPGLGPVGHRVSFERAEAGS
jgi:hypothetical protein